MDFDRSSISPTESAGLSPGSAQIPKLKLQNQSFSSLRSINLGRTNSPRSQDQENEYILGETRKLIQKGKYTKAFINLRRYLMDQDLNKSILPEFYQQVVHTCHKIIEKYFTKPPAKIMSKVPPLMSISYQYLNQWDSFLVNLQGEQDCQNLIFGRSASVQEQVLLKKTSLILRESQEDKSPAYKQSRFQRDNSRKRQANQDDEQKITSINNQDEREESNNRPGGLIKLEIGQYQFDSNDKLGNEGSEQFQQDGSQEDKFNPMILIKDKFHLYREQMLAYYLKTLYLSYRFHRMINQPMRSLKFLKKGSEIVRDFLSNLLFISSAELSRIATYKPFLIQIENHKFN